MKIKSFKVHHWKLPFSEKPLSQYVFSVIDENGLLEITGYNRKEAYIIFFQTEQEAKIHISIENLKSDVSNSWYRNRHNAPIQIDTTQKRWKSKFVPIQYAINKMIGVSQ